MGGEVYMAVVRELEDFQKLSNSSWAIAKKET